MPPCTILKKVLCSLRRTGIPKLPCSSKGGLSKDVREGENGKMILQQASGKNGSPELLPPDCGSLVHGFCHSVAVWTNGQQIFKK
eukprot:g19501.t1